MRSRSPPLRSSILVVLCGTYNLQSINIKQKTQGEERVEQLLHPPPPSAPQVCLLFPVCSSASDKVFAWLAVRHSKSSHHPAAASCLPLTGLEAQTLHRKTHILLVPVIFNSFFFTVSEAAWCVLSGVAFCAAMCPRVRQCVTQSLTKRRWRRQNESHSDKLFICVTVSTQKA